VYRSARGTKHHAYRALDSDVTPAQSSVSRGPPNSFHLSQRDSRSEGKSRRQQGRSSSSSTAMSTSRDNEGLLIDLSDDTISSSTSTAPATRGQSKNSKSSKTSKANASNADVLSLLDGSIAGKYGCLPLPLGEKHTGPYDPFEISAELKCLSSLSSTPLNSASADVMLPLANSMSPRISSSSFDSFSSEGTPDESPMASAQDKKTNYAKTASAVDVKQAALRENDPSIMSRGSSLTNLPIYGNLPVNQVQENGVSRSCSNFVSEESNNIAPMEVENWHRSKESRSSVKHEPKHDSAADLNANSFSIPQGKAVSVTSMEWLESAISKNLSFAKNSTESRSVNADPANGANSKSTAMAAVWDEKNLSKGMVAARNKVSSSGTTFYDEQQGYMNPVKHRPAVTRDEALAIPPPIPPRDLTSRYEMHTVSSTQPSIYSNLADLGRQHSIQPASGGGETARLTGVPLTAQSSDIYQNFEEFSGSASSQSIISASKTHKSSGASSTENGRPASHRQVRATLSIGNERPLDVPSKSSIDRVRRRVPSASRDECQAALAALNNDVESAARHLKVDQLVRLGIAPRDRCRTLLEACNWSLESAGSALLHEVSTGSSV